MNILEHIIGKFVSEIAENNYSIHIKFDDGSAVIFYHEQSCCESVEVEDVNGDWIDLVGAHLLVAESRSSSHNKNTYPDGEEKWTFYTFRGVKGSVDVRWFGTSNGYYSVEVDTYYVENYDYDELDSSHKFSGDWRVWNEEHQTGKRIYVR